MTSEIDGKSKYDPEFTTAIIIIVGLIIFLQIIITWLIPESADPVIWC